VNVQFSNLGGVHMLWGIGVAATPSRLSWDVPGRNGSLDGSALLSLPLKVNSEGRQARAAPYDTTFTLNASSPEPTPIPESRTPQFAIHTVISATPDAAKNYANITQIATPNAQHSSNLASVTTSSVVHFVVVPVDSEGLNILDASQVAYNAKLFISTTLETLACSVSYDTTTDSHRGECNPPSLVAGDFAIEVLDASGSLVGEQTHEFQIVDCPVTYFLDNEDYMCKCKPGTYDQGSTCAMCPAGTVATDAGSVDCNACPARESSNSTRTHCDYDADYYRNGENECSLCPLSQVSCAWGSTVTNWTLKPGVWCSDQTSTDLRTCRFGAASCPGDTDYDAGNCTAIGFGDWPHCGCGYVGPTCAACAPEYFLD
jgi:hypothetical protein